MKRSGLLETVLAVASLGMYVWAVLGDAQRRVIRARVAHELRALRVAARRVGEPAWLTELRDNHVTADAE